MSQFEIEVKSLLGEKSVADALKEKMQAADAEFTFLRQNKQLNHYFVGGDIEKMYEEVKGLFGEAQQQKLRYAIENGEGFSVRTRQKDEEVLLVVKASLDGGTSENTVKRIEFEEPVTLSLEQLDQKVLAADFVYQAKWSREREEYSYGGATVCFDKNAGYGYLVEFEKVITDEAAVDAARDEIDTLMAELGVEELSQERLARMFEYYNENWADYYGTEKTFTLE